MKKIHVVPNQIPLRLLYLPCFWKKSGPQNMKAIWSRRKPKDSIVFSLIWGILSYNICPNPHLQHLEWSRVRMLLQQLFNFAVTQRDLLSDQLCILPCFCFQECVPNYSDTLEGILLVYRSFSRNTGFLGDCWLTFNEIGRQS